MFSFKETLGPNISNLVSLRNFPFLQLYVITFYMCKFFVVLARSKESGKSIHLIFVPSPTTKNANICIHN